MRASLITAMAMAFAGCSAPSSPPTESTRLTVLYFDGCPNTPPTIDAARHAAATLGPAWEVVTIDLEDLPESDLRRGYGSPTILLDGHDLFGAPTPTATALSCRHYPDGPPTEASITNAVRQRADPDP